MIESIERCPRVSLDQWRAFVHVVDAGGYAAAAARLHRTQSSISYAVQQIALQVGSPLFVRDGRRAVLSPLGAALLPRARILLEDALSLEALAREHRAGWEPEVWVAVDVPVPPALLTDALERFGEAAPAVRVEVLETVLSGTREALADRRVAFAVTPGVPVDAIGEHLLDVDLVAVAHPDHPLHHLGRSVTLRDLREHRHLLVRDSGGQRDERVATVEVERRWVFSGVAASLAAARRGLGFAWYPEPLVAGDLARGSLALLPLPDGGRRRLPLYLVFADAQTAGPGAVRLAEAFRQAAAMIDACRSSA